MAQTVVGIFKSQVEAENAVTHLLDNGFTKDNVDISSGSSSVSSVNSSENENESGIAKFFKNLFGSDTDESERYSRAAGRGHVVTVYTTSASQADSAAMLLDQYGAVDVNDQDQQYSTGTAVSGNNDLSDSTLSNSDGVGKTIPIIEENLLVGKREIETGGVRLRSRIIEKPVEESLRLREEHIRIERTKVDRAATDADLKDFEEGTIELTEHAEVPVINKEARIVEEVSLGKDVEHRQETIKDTVRRTEVDVEELKSDSNLKNDF